MSGNYAGATQGHIAYPLFDWLRILAASVVALGHQGMPAIGPVDGTLAVTVFLALSGWLIGGILLQSQTSDLPRFFFNRATRIWIPYAFAILLIFGLAALREGIDLNWLKYLFYDLTFTHYTFTEFPRALSEMPLGGTGNHFWSITVEEQFYLIAPLLILLLPFGKRLWAWIIISLALLWLQSIFAAISLGVTAAILARDNPGWYHKGWPWAIVWAGAAAAFALCVLADTPALRAIFAVLLVQSLAIPGNRGAVGMFFGAVSYPFYLNHWMATFIVNALEKRILPLPEAVSFPLTFLVALGAGIATWALIDRPVMQNRQAWFTRQHGVILGLAGYMLVITGLIGGSLIRAGGG